MFDLKAFGAELFETMIASMDMGITPPMTFALRRNGETQIETLSDNLAELLSRGVFKDAMFAFWRRQCAHPGVEAFAHGSEAWSFAPNKKGRRLEQEEKDRYKSMLDHGFTKLVAGGFGEAGEAFHLIAQSRTRVVVMSRRFHRIDGKTVWLGETTCGESDQEHFKGRGKMWGDLRPENLS